MTIQYLIGPLYSLNAGISILSEVDCDEIACELTDGGALPESNAVGSVRFSWVIETQCTPAIS